MLPRPPDNIRPLLLSSNSCNLLSPIAIPKCNSLRTGFRPLSEPDSESVVEPGDADVSAEPPGSELELGPELGPGSDPNPNPAALRPAPELPPSEANRSELAESVREACRNQSPGLRRTCRPTGNSELSNLYGLHNTAHRVLAILVG